MSSPASYEERIRHLEAERTTLREQRDRYRAAHAKLEDERDALRAERQQAIDALREACDCLAAEAEGWRPITCKAQAKLGRAALVKLGEKP